MSGDKELTTYTFIVLHEPGQAPRTLDNALSACDSGPLIGALTGEKTQPVPAGKVHDLLLDMGNDGAWFDDDEIDDDEIDDEPVPEPPPASTRVAIVHYRSPDYECSHDVWVNNQPVNEVDVEDIDPSRGYQWSDWWVRLIYAYESAKGEPAGGYAQTVLQHLVDSSDSDYISEKPGRYRKMIAKLLEGKNPEKIARKYSDDPS